MAARFTKISALMGVGITLSDEQLVDSQGIVTLFRDPAFSRFLQENPGFLALTPRAGVPSGSESRLRFLAFSLQWTLRPEWISSLNLPIQALVRVLLEEASRGGHFIGTDWLKDNIARGSIGEFKGEHPNDANDLQAILDCWMYFAGNEEAPISAPMDSNRTTMYEVLLDLMETNGLPNEASRCLSVTKDFIDTHVPDPDKHHFQSDVFTALDHFDGSPKMFRLIRNTAHHCWNIAVQQTVNPSSGSIGDLPDTVPLSLHVKGHGEADRLIPFEANRTTLPLPRFSSRGLGVVPFDPSDRGWDEISAALQTSSVHDARDRWISARESKDDLVIAEAMHTYCSVLGSYFSTTGGRSQDGRLWTVGAGFGGSIAVWFGMAEIAALLMATSAGRIAVARGLQERQRIATIRTFKDAAEIVVPD